MEKSTLGLGIIYKYLHFFSKKYYLQIFALLKENVYYEQSQKDSMMQIWKKKYIMQRNNTHFLSGIGNNFTNDVRKHYLHMRNI